MCSISGGTKWDKIAETIFTQSRDRGRDSSGLYRLSPTGLWVANHRATPTTEVISPSEEQPVGDKIKLVFNGIISNDEELGVQEGEADTSVLPRVLDFSSLLNFKDSISKIIGSYAIACIVEKEIWLAANYKPIWIAEKDNNWYFSSLKNHFPKQIIPYKMPPYSVQNLIDHNSTLELPRKQSKKAIVICSSGLDSTSVASYACFKHGPENVTLLHFNYGCKATNQEIKSIRKIQSYLKCDLKILPMSSFGSSTLLEKNATFAEAKEGAEYAHEWVPARNLLMLSTSVAYAEAKNYGHIYLGTNLEEAGAYPDNEEQFILDFSNLLYGAVQNGIKIEIHTPLGGLMKHEIIPFGLKYNTPYHLTWSCYDNKKHHCGKCGPCFMRKTAFERNGLVDPVKYEETK